MKTSIAIAAVAGLMLLACHSGTQYGSLTGTVWDHTNVLASGVRITTVPATKVAVTSVTGQFILDSLLAGSYTLIADRTGEATHKEAVNVKAGQTVDLKIHMVIGP